MRPNAASARTPGPWIGGTPIPAEPDAPTEDTAAPSPYRRLFEESVAGVFRTTLEGEFLECNRAFAEMFGFEDPEEVLELRATELYRSAADRDDLEERLRDEGAVESYELRVQDRDGEPFWVLEHSILMDDPERTEPVICGTVVDITERKRLEEELERLAYHDPLTGLANRRLMREQAKQALAAADREGRRVAIGYLDITRFQRINETLGHRAGDEALATIGRRIEAQLRSSDLAARAGGDEFALLLTRIGTVEDAEVAGRRILEALEDPIEVQGQRVTVEARMGVAVYPEHGSNFDELLANADHSMYRIPRERARGVRLYHAEQGLPRQDELALEEALRRAMREEEFRLHYQPVFRLPGEELAGAEALIRWNHPERGIIAAAEFVPLAERLGLMGRLDRWVLGEAIRQMSEGWDGAGEPDWVAVNLSGSALADPELGSGVRDRLASGGVEGKQLVIEITERAAMQNPGEVSAVLQGLRDMGVRTVIDDFGTGHAVLAYIKRFPASMLKIDRFFLEGVPHRPEDQSLVEGIAGLARGLGLSVVVEGVETPEQMEWVRASDCDYVQGFHTGRPGPPEELTG